LKKIITVTTVCFSLFIIGCSSHKEVKIPLKALKKPIIVKKEKKIVLTPFVISQNSDDYVDMIPKQIQDANQSRYEQQYFKIWNQTNPQELKGKLKWAFRAYNTRNSYGENLQAIKQSFFDEMLNNANYEKFSTINKKAVTLRELNIRAYPTGRPLLMNPKLAGEGFPFDYLQNSTIHANKPIVVTHYSKDKAWVHIQSSFTFGWVKANEIVFIKDKYAKLWQQAQQVFLTKDDVPIYSKSGNYLFNSKLGMMLALVDEDSKNYTVLVVASSKTSQPYFTTAKISKNVAHKNILLFTKKNVSNILTELLKSNYGWGGMYGQRDCSSTLRDFFAPFGIWLPRNSYQQSKVGFVTSLKNLSNKEKIVTIKENAIPFRTLLYKKGHIVLYTGIHNNHITIFQNMWGIKTKKNNKEGRYIIGRTLFSNLDFGKELTYYDDNASFLNNLKSMNTIHIPLIYSPF